MFFSFSVFFWGEGEQLGWWVNRNFLFFNLQQLESLSKFISLPDFSPDFSGISPAGQEMIDVNLRKLTQLVNKESNLIEKVAFLHHCFPVCILGCVFI